MAQFTKTALGAAGFPEAELINVATRVVAVPVREVYGMLFRAGIIEITG